MELPGQSSIIIHEDDRLFMKPHELYRLFTKNNGMPNYVIFHFTSICNSKCVTCFNWKNLNKKDELSTDEIRKISEHMMHIEYLTLGGGEPFLRKDLSEICRIFYLNNGVRAFSIPTNGLSPDVIRKTTQEIVEKCPDALARVSLSIDGIDELHDTIRGIKGNFKKIWETHNNLQDLKKRYPNLRILAATTFCTHNQDKAMEIYRYIKENMKVDQYNINYIRGDARNPILKDVDIEKYKELIDYIEMDMPEKKSSYIERLFDLLPILTRKDVLKTLQSKDRIYECYAGQKMIVMDSFGNVFPCEMLDEKLGNLRNYGYDLKKILKLNNTRSVLKYIKDRKCNCTWECAIQDSLVYNYNKYPYILKRLVIK
ncbi:MAG: radical SAM protein [Candidatus Mariimomonas ferrooxydans]